MDLIYFYTPGACSLSGMVVLEWTKLPYRLCRVERAARGSAAFRKVNPHGKVPAMRMDGRPLAENAAILLALAGRSQGEKLVPPEGTFERDLLHQYLSYLGTGFHVAFYPMFVPQRYVKDESLYSAVKDAAVDQVRQQVAIIEEHLSQKTYMLGETRTVLDPYLYAMSRWTKKFFDVAAEYPHVARHQSKMEEDPAMKFALAIEQGETVESPSGKFQGHVALEAI